MTEFRVGARGHYSLMKALDIYAEGLFFNSKYNGSGDGVSSTTDTGGIYEGGFRLKAHKKAEINLAYRYKSGEWDESYIVPGGVIMITKKIGISVKDYG